MLSTLPEEEQECTCKCATAKKDGKDKENEVAEEGGCKCVCHFKGAYGKGQSGHFHRVEQLVKGTKRVVRDIKNVL